MLLELQDADRLKQAERADRVGVCRVFRRFEAHLHVALGGEIVDFVRPYLLQQADQVRRVRQIAVVKEKAAARFVRILIEMIDPACVEGRRTPFHAMHGVTLGEQQFGEISAVLAGRAGD